MSKAEDKNTLSFTLAVPGKYKGRVDMEEIIREVIHGAGQPDGLTILLMDTVGSWSILEGESVTASDVRHVVLRMHHYLGGCKLDDECSSEDAFKLFADEIFDAYSGEVLAAKLVAVAVAMYSRVIEDLQSLKLNHTFNPDLYRVLPSGRSIYLTGSEGKTLN